MTSTPPTAAVADTDRLRAARARLGLSQRAMAEALSTPRRTYEDWEAGVSRIPGPVWLALQWLNHLHPTPQEVLHDGQ